MYHLRIVLIIPLVVLNSCNWFLEESEEEHITGNYYVGWADLESNRSIKFRKKPEGTTSQVVVDGYVFAVGNNDKFIIAKSISSPNSNLIHYHIINTEKNIDLHPDNNSWSSSNVQEFERRRSDLGISDLEFDKVYTKDPW